jgi:folylpolyglutamate synthase/dihydropteroate synthase
MQSLPVQIATTFVGDAFAFVNGFARIATHILMTPVERIAKACDVAGILHERAQRTAERDRVRRAWRALSRDTAKPHRSRRHGHLFGCLHFLGELT